MPVKRPVKRIWWAMLSLVFLFPHPVLALQPHGPPEGLYTHQMAHVLFAGALLFLIYSITREGLWQFRGFRLLLWAYVLFVLWNVDAFVGHWVEVHLGPQDFAGSVTDFSQRLRLSGVYAWVYYFAKFDHIILAPAFYLLYLGLKSLAQAAQTGKI